MNTPSWDLFIGLFFIIGVSYGFILQREKTTVTILSAYVGLVIAQALNPIVQGFFSGDKTIGSFFIRANASPFTVQVAIFLIVTVLMSTRAGIIGQRARGLLSPIEVLIYSFLNSALIISSIINFMPEDKKTALLASSKLASKIITYNIWWLILPVLALVIIGFRKGIDKE
ncbi:MAG: Uncharacterized protein CEN91_600 [Candidatus Berkelbacteria bacterium Licking1014_85]|uniref:Colicin V production protein n=1 Tax=Candidatus Berkelbacteria bacterium Licking1014_85 TaxID=2017148 RepID=A0A554LFS7_9BACT|nr:MAG: Uncharacterized protein CEN91_600 [Candidatus Berkelbacteria bacterium Licking1014_85]